MSSNQKKKKKKKESTWISEVELQNKKDLLSQMPLPLYNCKGFDLGHAWMA